MKSVRFATILLLSSLFAQAGLAQGEYVSLGTRIPDFPREYREMVKDVDATDPASVAIAHQAFTRCIAVHRVKQALPVLQLPLHSEEQFRATADLFKQPQACLGRDLSEMRVSAHLMVGGIAEAFVVNDPLLAAAVTSQPALGSSELSELVGRTSMETVAICAVRKEPAAVIALLRSDVRSQAELDALSLVATDLGSCIPTGVEAKFDAASLRALVANGAYLVAIASDAPGTS